MSTHKLSPHKPGHWRKVQVLYPLPVIIQQIKPTSHPLTSLIKQVAWTIIRYRITLTHGISQTRAYGKTQKTNSYLKFGNITLPMEPMNGETMLTKNLLLPQVMMSICFVVFASQITYAQIKEDTAFPFQEQPPSPFLLFIKDRR